MDYGKIGRFKEIILYFRNIFLNFGSACIKLPFLFVVSYEPRPPQLSYCGEFYSASAYNCCTMTMKYEFYCVLAALAWSNLISKTPTGL